jgi:hypothetical protein
MGLERKRKEEKDRKIISLADFLDLQIEKIGENFNRETEKDRNSNKPVDSNK